MKNTTMTKKRIRGRTFDQQLEEEYDYQRSDEYLRDLCEGNEYRFDEDGELL